MVFLQQFQRSGRHNASQPGVLQLIEQGQQVLSRRLDPQVHRVGDDEPRLGVLVERLGLHRGRGVREEDELAGCYDEVPGDQRTALFRIDVIEIPVDDPASARIVDSPTVFADPETGVLAGLWRGGDHGDETQDTRVTDECHDITVFPELGIAGGACSGNGILFDISDPQNQ